MAAEREAWTYRYYEIKFKVTRLERHEIFLRAKDEGLTVSEYLRRKALA